jgi:hypothetical protein
MARLYGSCPKAVSQELSRHIAFLYLPASPALERVEIINETVLVHDSRRPEGSGDISLYTGLKFTKIPQYFFSAFKALRHFLNFHTEVYLNKYFCLRFQEQIRAKAAAGNPYLCRQSIAPI